MKRSYRILAAGALVTAVGRGLYIPASIVYFTTQLDLSANQVGLGLSCAGAGALLGALPLGAVMDKARRPRDVAVIYGILHSLAMFSLLIADSFAIFVALVTVLGVAERASSIARQTLVALLFTAEERVITQARLRTVTNVGTSAGALIAALSMASNLPGIYGTLIAGNGAALLCLAGLLALVPAGRSTPGVSVPPGWGVVLRDRSFIAIALLNGVLSLHSAILRVGLPLWVTLRIGGPSWLVPIMYGVNTVLTVVMQVRTAGMARTTAKAAAVLRWSGWFTAGACVTMLLTLSVSRSTAVVLAILGVVLLTAGEVTQSAGGWGLAYGLSRSRAEGTYLGAFSIGTGVQDLAGPLLVTAVLIGLPVVGPVVIAVGLVVAGCAVPAVYQYRCKMPAKQLSTV